MHGPFSIKLLLLVVPRTQAFVLVLMVCGGGGTVVVCDCCCCYLCTRSLIEIISLKNLKTGEETNIPSCRGFPSKGWTWKTTLHHVCEWEGWWHIMNLSVILSKMKRNEKKKLTYGPRDVICPLGLMYVRVVVQWWWCAAVVQPSSRFSYK
jgi:hypothetical protein